MAMKILMPKPNFSARHLGQKQPPNSHSFGQVCLPRKVENFPSKQSFLVSATMAIKIGESNHNPTLANIWREIQGSNNWDNLVEPLHPLLRQEIIRYGEFVTACYKAFDLDPNSNRFLSCKYGKNNMFKHVGLENCGYVITKYIYATPDINIPIQNGSSCSRWIGYVAVSSNDTVQKLGRRDILITFRGTITPHEWIANLMSSLTPARLDPNNQRPNVKVESGFLSLYTCDESDNKFGPESCRQQLLSEVSRLLYKYRGQEISISMAGHSMGSSLALLLAYDISELGLNRVNPAGNVIPVTVFSFGGPRVGNARFKDRCEELGVKVLRIVNVNDPITKLPGVFLNENFRVLGGKFEFPWSCSCYAHVGIELVLDFFNMQNPSCVHDLEAYIESLLMKCPKRFDPEDHDVDDDDDDGGDRQLQVDFVNRAMEFLMGAQNFKILQFEIAMRNIINFLQSQRAEFLFDQNIYMWMNNLALYIFL